MAWLYDRDPSLAERDIRDREGGLGGSRLSVPDWLGEVHRLFPQETIERLERDAVERYQIHEVVTSKEVLARIQPNETLLRAVLLTKHLMNPEVLALARDLVAKVVRKLMEKLARDVRQSFGGARVRRRSLVKLAKNFDVRGTVRKNARVKALCDQGSLVLGLAALDEQAKPAYDRDLARRLVDVGAHVGAMTPGQLVDWIAQKVKR
jgi:hypothetical protein